MDYFQALQVLARKRAASASLLREDWEAAPTGWSTAGSGTVTLQATDRAFAGTYSAKLAPNFASGVTATKSLSTPASSVSVYFVFQYDATPSSSNRPVIEFLDSSDNILCSINLSSSNGVKIIHGATATSDAGGLYAPDTWLHNHLSYEAGSGSNGKAVLYVSSDGVKGTADRTISTGTGTADVAKIRLNINGNNYDPGWFDNLLVVSGYDTLGDNPF